MHGAATAATDADGAGITMGGGAVREQGDFSLACRDVALGVGGVELIGAAANAGGVDDIRVQAKIFSDIQAAHTATVTSIIDGIHIRPVQAGIT